MKDTNQPKPYAIKYLLQKASQFLWELPISEECELKTTMQTGVYALMHGRLRLLSQEEFKTRRARRAQSSAQTEESPADAAPPAASAGAAAASSPRPETGENTTVAVTSQPAGADIEVDGSFMGSTPSSIELASGEHVVVLRKRGFKAWERRLRLTGGRISVNADMETDDAH
jgi:CRISPR/Cas system-associated exonuclease Cas4 (RecB family)